jgi:DNA polymerase-3 subunit delta'
MSDDVDPRDTPRHPRRRSVLFGHEQAENRLLQAYRSGRLHHAWLIAGPRGIGKATLAYRFARFLLHTSAALPQKDAASLHVDPDHPVARRTAAGSHADLFVVERRFDPRTGRLKTETGVDIARMASDFFSRSAGEGGWRVCIVDTADDLNLESANALLKSLEEPPSRSIFLLVANRPGMLLRTIRSRCIDLHLEPLSEQHVAEAVSGVLGAEAPLPADITIAARLSGGSPGRALELLGSGRTRIFSEFRSLVSGLPRLDRRQALAFADQMQGRAGAEDFDIFCELLADWIADRARTEALASKKSAAAWATAHAELNHSIRRTNALNLDRRQLVMQAFEALRDAAGRSQNEPAATRNIR